jgi:drug/metabolite transporter (DMT)-like permease
MVIPLIAAFISAITLILEKFELSYQKVNYKAFNVFIFASLFAITALFFPKFGWIRPEATHIYYIVIGILMVFTAVGWNILLSQALQKERVIEFELIQMLEPVLVIFLASLFFSSERSIYILPAAVVGSLALIAGHLKKHHIYFNKYDKYLLFAIVLMAIETIFNKIMLQVYSPVALYMVRTFFVFITMWIFLRPSFTTVNFKSALAMFGTAGLAVAQMVLYYTAIHSEGLVFTTLIFILSPALVYIFSMIIYKEKLKLRTAISFAIILACIVFASLMEKR